MNIHRACRERSMIDIKRLLKDNSIDVNAEHPNNCNTVLRLAVENNDLEVTYLLLKSKRVDNSVLYQRNVVLKLLDDDWIQMLHLLICAQHLDLPQDNNLKHSLQNHLHNGDLVTLLQLPNIAKYITEDQFRGIFVHTCYSNDIEVLNILFKLVCTC
jgi:hypothetical protein